MGIPHMVRSPTCRGSLLLKPLISPTHNSQLIWRVDDELMITRVKGQGCIQHNGKGSGVPVHYYSILTCVNRYTLVPKDTGIRGCLPWPNSKSCLYNFAKNKKELLLSHSKLV